MVEVGDVGCQVVAGRDIHVGIEWIASEVNRTAVSNLEVLVNDLLEAEIVVSLGNLHISIHAQVAFCAILDLQTAISRTLDAVAGYRIHDEFDDGIRGDFQQEIHAKLCPVIGLGDQRGRLCRDGVGSVA